MFDIWLPIPDYRALGKGQLCAVFPQDLRSAIWMVATRPLMVGSRRRRGVSFCLNNTGPAILMYMWTSARESNLSATRKRVTEGGAIAFKDNLGPNSL